MGVGGRTERRKEKGEEVEKEHQGGGIGRHTERVCKEKYDGKDESEERERGRG